MSQANAGWLFYKMNFFHLTDSRNPEFSLSEINKVLLNIKAQNSNAKPCFTNSFEAKTIYPGLIIGAGYSHGIKGEKENFDLGFYFDHTTGMPIIPGSTVKGVLRSIFKRLKNEDQKKAVLAFFKDIFSLCGISSLSDISDNDACEILKKIENNIFEGRDGDNNQNSLYNRDKFFDAIIKEGDDENLIFDVDNIAPHYKNILKEPNVIKLLKVRPNVTFEFSFELHNMYIENDLILTAKAKEKLFDELLLYTGVGAKTNVGYGQFESKKIVADNHTGEENNIEAEEVASLTDTSDAEYEKLMEMISSKEDIGVVTGYIKEISESLSTEKRKKIFEIYNQKLLEINSELEATWYGESIEDWFSNDMTNGQRKKLMDYTYLNIFKALSDI